MKKMLVLFLALLLLCPTLNALAEAEEGVYVLMTIPYSLFYEAETTGGQYDSVSSATRVKPLLITYVGGSFHYMPDGQEITGVIFPVYVESEEMLAMYGGEEITNDSSVTIRVNDGGQVIETTYTGKDALFESFPFSYYRLSDAPAVYKALGWDSSFSPMEGLTVSLSGAIRLVDDPYADICVAVDGVEEALSNVDVNALVIACQDGTRVGMKHLENIWQKTFAGFALDSEVYSLLQGKTITSVEVYTHEARYIISSEEGVRID